MMAASYDDGSVLQQRQRTSTTEAYYDDGRRWQRHDKGDCRSQRRQRFVSTADNGALYEDNGIGLYRRKTTAAADIDDDAIGSSFSLIRGSKQQSTDDRGEETAATIQRPMGDGGEEIQQSALTLGGGTVVGAWKSPKPRRGGVVARNGGCIRRRGRDKRAHHDKYIDRAEV